mgnify:CR=1 FL=1
MKRVEVGRVLRQSIGWVARGVVALTGASGMTLLCFLILPLIQAITEGDSRNLVIQAVETVALPPPPPAPEPERDEEPEEEEKPPELAEESTPLDLSQLEVALEPGLGAGMGGSVLEFTIGAGGPGASGEDPLDLDDLDQRPRVTYQPGPQLSTAIRKAGGGTVYVLFIVNKRGRVQDPIVQQSPNPVLNRPALDAVKKWRFEPGEQKGEAVSFRMRVPITFPKGDSK